jgi:Protein of unknown function (DUF664)
MTFAEDVIDQPARVQFEAFIDEHRSELNGCLDGLTEGQARRSLVPSRTTLLGLVKHATFVEKAWLDEAVTCRPCAEVGIPATPDESLILHAGDTIATVRQAHREACESCSPGVSVMWALGRAGFAGAGDVAAAGEKIKCSRRAGLPMIRAWICESRPSPSGPP